jgi:hypothetical protein
VGIAVAAHTYALRRIRRTESELFRDALAVNETR